MQNKLDPTYRSAVQAIKEAILASQYSAVRMINQKQLALYYGIGKYISENSRKGHWGTNAIENISAQLSIELPGLKGFSSRNLKLMRQFYESWAQLMDERLVKTAAMAAEMEEANMAAVAAETKSSYIIDMNFAKVTPFEGTEMTWADFLSIGFTHHTEILTKTSSVEQRAFYVHQTALNHWDKYTLREMLKADVYTHQSSMPNNFAQTLPRKKQSLRAIEMFKDEYMLDFVNVEQLGENEDDIDEAVIEKHIILNIKNFIMEFGRSFTFKGSQVHYDKLGHDHWVDLLFFNRELQSLVVVELKKGAFKPAYLGQLAAYLRILDDEERLPNENPSIGIILCKDADRAYVEYVLQDYQKPMGVATYKWRTERLKELLPDENQLKELL